MKYTEFTYYRQLVRRDFEKYRYIRDPKEIEFQLKVRSHCIRYNIVINGNNVIYNIYKVICFLPESSVFLKLRIGRTPVAAAIS